MVRAKLNTAEEEAPEQLRSLGLHAKRLEFKLAAARLAQAEYHVEALVVRSDFLEAQCERGTASRSEREELEWILEALPISTSTLFELAIEFEQRNREMEALLKPSEDSNNVNCQGHPLE